MRPKESKRSGGAMSDAGLPAAPTSSRAERAAERRGGARAAAGSPAAPTSNRAERAAERRATIVAAALDEFVARGFTATRLDDVAKRAGVAKGTIYLHFKDKEALFEELVRTAIVPVVERITTPPPMNGSVRDALEGFARMFIQEVVGTRRADIIRLIIAEGPRFPAIADFYYREVISRGMAAMRGLIQIAVKR